MKQILFLGHSVLYYYPKDYLKNWKVINRSISGSIAKEGYKQLQDSSIDFSALDAILLMYGINELHYRFKLDILLENLVNILNYLEHQSFTGHIILALIMRGWESNRYDNRSIDDINEKIKHLSKDFKVDLFEWKSFYNEKDEVDLIYSNDGIHLNSKGYEKFKVELVKLLEGKKEKNLNL